MAILCALAGPLRANAEDAPPRRERVQAEVAGGIVGLGVGSGAVALLYAGECAAVLSSGGDMCGLSILAAPILVPLGAGSGVYLSGGQVDGGGRFAAAWLGSELGFIGGLVGGALIAGLGETAMPGGDGVLAGALVVTVIAGGTVIGGIVGYERSNARAGPSLPEGTAAARVSARLLPSLTREGVDAVAVVTW